VARSVGAREVGARARLSPPRRLRHVRVDSVKASETCFLESWRQQLRHGSFGAPVLFGPWTSSVRTDVEEKRLWFMVLIVAAAVRNQSLATLFQLARKPHVLSLAILLPTAEMILSSRGRFCRPLPLLAGWRAGGK